MKEFIKTKAATGIIILATVLLAGVAVFTALRLYQLRQEPVAPSAPESTPQATSGPQACTSLAFNLSVPQSPTPTSVPGATNTPTNSPTPTDLPIGGGSPTPTKTPTPTQTVSASATVTPKPSNTPTLTPTGQPIGGTSPTPTLVAQSSPTPTSGLLAQASPTTAPGTGGANDQLPSAGVSLPTILSLAIGVLLLIGAFIFAL